MEDLEDKGQYYLGSSLRSFSMVWMREGVCNDGKD